MSDNFQKKGARQEKMIFHDEDTPNDNDSDSPDSRNEEKDNDNKSKKKYSVISQAIREKFINRVLSKEVTIKEAAKEFGLKFSTSKAILQTYKKEGRIGKKKNRERKTKVVNVVFVCNINPNSPYTSSVFPIIAVNEIKGAKASMNAEDNKNRLVEEALSRYPEHKIIQQSHLQIPNDSNKSTTQFIKELGNEFLKDFIEKNFNPNKMSLSDSLNYGLQNPMGNVPNPQGSIGMGNVPNMSNIVNFNHIQPPHLNGQYGMQQQTHNMSTEIPQTATMSHYNLNQPSPNQINQSLNQKRSFQQYERDTIPDLDLKSEQIADISVKKFKSGEEAFYDFDMDRSKKDLEDFIYKTQTAIKNNSYASKDKTFDFSKYRDEFYE